MSGKRRISVVSRHSTEKIADATRAKLESAQQHVRRGGVADPERIAAEGVLYGAGVGAMDDLTTRHERFRRLKWAVGIFV